MAVPAITPFYAGILGLIMLYLVGRVPMMRRRYKIGIGFGGNEELARAIRVHANFIENVPYALLLMLLLEMRGSSAWLLHALGITLIAARLLHAYGVSKSSGVSFGRMVGFILTWAVLLVGSLLCISNFPHLNL